jgi:hypothetical protein
MNVNFLHIIWKWPPAPLLTSFLFSSTAITKYHFHAPFFSFFCAFYIYFTPLTSNFLCICPFSSFLHANFLSFSRFNFIVFLPWHLPIVFSSVPYRSAWTKCIWLEYLGCWLDQDLGSVDGQVCWSGDRRLLITDYRYRLRRTNFRLPPSYNYRYRWWQTDGSLPVTGISAT